VTDLDRNSGFADSSDLSLSPQTGDVVRFTVEEVTVPERRDPIKVVELRDFTIEIFEAIKDGSRVTIHGVATSKTNNAELEISLGVRSFYDHNNNRTEMTGKRVSLGDWIRTSGNTARISETFNRNESKRITWSFTNVPENANKLSRVDLWLKTSYEDNTVIELRDIDL